MLTDRQKNNAEKIVRELTAACPHKVKRWCLTYPTGSPGQLEIEFENGTRRWCVFSLRPCGKWQPWRRAYIKGWPLDGSPKFKSFSGALKAGLKDMLAIAPRPLSPFDAESTL